MKIALIIVAALFAVVVVSLVIGVMLPRQHQATREITLNRSPQQIYMVARDFASSPAWRRNIARVEMFDPVDGRVRFREHSKDGSITYEIVEEVANEKLVTRIIDRNLGYSGSWTYRFAPAQNGTRVSITEDGDVSNILFRFMSRFVFGHTSTMDAYLRALGARFGETLHRSDAPSGLLGRKTEMSREPRAGRCPEKQPD